jgi:hypothetical protein
VALEGHLHLGGRHAAAIVDHAQEFFAAAACLDPHVARSCVDAVLHQLLDHRGGTLHHLAGGDLRGDLFRKYANGHTDLLVSHCITQPGWLRVEALDKLVFCDILYPSIV